MDFLLPAVLALSAALIFAGAIHLANQGLQTTDAATGTLISIGASTTSYWLFAPWMLETRFWFSPAMWVFVGIGLLRPHLSTRFLFLGTQRLGPTVSTTLAAVAPMFAVTGAVLILNEPLTLPVALGTCAVVTGVVAFSWRGGADRSWLGLALFFPLGTALIRASAHVASKAGLDILPSPFFAGMIAYTTSFVLLLALRAAGDGRRGAMTGPSRNLAGLPWLVGAGAGNALGIFVLNTALQQGQVVQVVPLAATSPLFTLLISVLFYRREVFHRWTLAGILLVVGGVIALTLFR